MLNRTIPPPRKTIPYPQFAWPRAYELKTGIPLFALHTSQQPIIRLELVCDAGFWYEPQNGVAYLTAGMLLEGTQDKSAQAISQYIDQYGASCYAQAYEDRFTLTLVTLSKYLVPMLDLFVSLLQEATFPEARLAHKKQRIIQALKVEDSQNSAVARKKFKETLFGANHPYGRHLTPTVIAPITSMHLRDYYQHRLFAGCSLLVSGHVREKDVQAIQQYLQPVLLPKSALKQPMWLTQAPAQVHCARTESLQTTIRMGKIVVSKQHPDYVSLVVVNALLGGYFGSRLMRNLREEKGYTYGIYSRLVAHRNASHWLIATEVRQTATQAAIREIKQEIATLRTVPVSKQELTLLRNYMLGAFLAGLNHPFAIMEKFKSVGLHGLSQAYYQQLYATIQGISAPQIMELAGQYLAENSLSTVTVGAAATK